MKRPSLAAAALLAALASGASAAPLEDASAAARAAVGAAKFSSFGSCALETGMASSDVLLIADADAPDFTVKDLDGREVKLSALRGKVVLLDFWATWCPPCRASTPALQALHAKYESQGLVILGMNQRESADKIRAFMGDKGLHYRVGLDDGSVGSAYQVRGIPTFVLVDKTGQVAWRKTGFGPDTAAEMAAAIEKALK